MDAAKIMELTGVNEQARFVLELEFIQCLANPHYLNWLALNKYFEDPAFINYLRYLDYWRQTQYVTYIRYPHCLQMLDLLQSDSFRKAIAAPVVMEELHTQQAFYWQHYLANRIKEAAEQGQGVALEAATVAAGPGSQVTSAAAAAAAVAVGAAGGITKQQQQQQ